MSSVFLVHLMTYRYTQICTILKMKRQSPEVKHLQSLSTSPKSSHARRIDKDGIFSYELSPKPLSRVKCILNEVSTLNNNLSTRRAFDGQQSALSSKMTRSQLRPLYHPISRYDLHLPYRSPRVISLARMLSVPVALLLDQ